MTETTKDFYSIAVLAPRVKTNYQTIMANVIKAIGTVEYHSDDTFDHYVFLHDGVTSGSTGYLIETLNKIQPSARQFEQPKHISYKKVPLDIEMYGKRSHYHWIDQVIVQSPDLIIAFDSGDEWSEVVKYAQRQAKKHNIRCDVINVKKETR